MQDRTAPDDSWTATWHRWTEPHPSIVRASLRDRVRMGATFTLVLLFLIIPLAILVPRLVNPDVPLHREPAAQGSALTVVLLVLTYRVLRGPRAEAGLVGLPLSMMAGIWYLILFGHRAPWEGAADFLVMVAAMSALLLSPRLSMVLWIANAAAFILFTQSEPPGHGHLVTILVLVVLPPLFVLGAVVRSRQVAVIEAQGLRLAQSEADLTAMLEASPQGMMTIDDAGRILFVNGPAARIFGYDKQELLSMGIEQLVPEGVRAKHPAHRAAFASHQEPRLLGLTRDLAGLRKDGGLVPLEIGLNTVQTSAGRLVVASIIDLTARRKAEELEREAVQRRADLEKASTVAKFRADLMNMVAHELKNPLTPLRLQVNVLGMPGVDAAHREKALHAIDRSVERLDAQVNHMLEASRLESGTTRLAVGDVDVAALVRDAVAAYQPVAAEARLALEARAPDGPAKMRGDKQRLAQVVDNLVSNAIKYTPAGGRVAVALEPSATGARIAVSDSGLGLTPEQQARLFQPFSKVHAPVSSKTPSTGLGLFITKGIVELHGGRIGVASAGPGQGSTFWLDLPREPPAEAPGTAAGAAPRPAP